MATSGRQVRQHLEGKCGNIWKASLATSARQVRQHLEGKCGNIRKGTDPGQVRTNMCNDVRLYTCRGVWRNMYGAKGMDMGMSMRMNRCVGVKISLRSDVCIEVEIDLCVAMCMAWA